MQEIGIARLHRIGLVGPYELKREVLRLRPDLEGLPRRQPVAAHRLPPKGPRLPTERTATDEDKKSIQRAAHREYLALQGISHDGIVRAEQYSDELPQPGRRFPAWRELAAPRPLHRRQPGPAAAHPPGDDPPARRGPRPRDRRHLYHRALAPRSVYVELDGRDPRLRIADWQVAARPDATTGGTVHTGATAGYTPASAAPPRCSPTSNARPAGTWHRSSPRPKSPAPLDVFGLGALSYLILTGQPPAATRGELATRLTQARALLPSAVIDSVSPAMDALVRDATQPSQADRTESVRHSSAPWTRSKRSSTLRNPTRKRTPSPSAPATKTKAGPIRGAWYRLHLQGAAGRNDGRRLRQPRLKVALNDAAARRLEKEAQQLAPLNYSHVARLLNQPFQAGPDGTRRTVIGVEYVGDYTLAEELRQHGPLTIHELEQLGADLFQAHHLPRQAGHLVP